MTKKMSDLIMTGDLRAKFQGSKSELIEGRRE